VNDYDKAQSSSTNQAPSKYKQSTKYKVQSTKLEAQNTVF